MHFRLIGQNQSIMDDIFKFHVIRKYENAIKTVCLIPVHDKCETVNVTMDSRMIIRIPNFFVCDLPSYSSVSSKTNVRYTITQDGEDITGGYVRFNEDEIRIPLSNSLLPGSYELDVISVNPSGHTKFMLVVSK